MPRRVALLAAVLLTLACGRSTSPTDPSSSIPDVAGNYSGTTTMNIVELGKSWSCPTTTSVTQTGYTVDIAPLVLTGDCGNMSLPLGQLAISDTGALNVGAGTGTYNDTCGAVNYVFRGGFVGRGLQISLTATSPTCYDYSMNVDVSR